jgi:hypothetical protein
MSSPRIVVVWCGMLMASSTAVTVASASGGSGVPATVAMKTPLSELVQFSILMACHPALLNAAAKSSPKSFPSVSMNLETMTIGRAVGELDHRVVKRED